MIAISFIILVIPIWLGALSIRLLILTTVLLVGLVGVLILLLLPMTLPVILLRSILIITITITIISVVIIIRWLLLLRRHSLRLSISRPIPQVITSVILMLSLRRRLLLLPLLAMPIVCHHPTSLGRARACSRLCLWYAFSCRQSSIADYRYRVRTKKCGFLATGALQTNDEALRGSLTLIRRLRSCGQDERVVWGLLRSLDQTPSQVIEADSVGLKETSEE